ncbi:urease accessory protein UreD [Gordonia sp. PDNC005]|uniref:urease accessory protein UreD n=1 Tax=unclassified Gordonia (in: high G+C Gram-positive bacteria) TaxID=2657482 RepID=UPI0019633752|nr:urease accessory protein UreD [Gordonia sp. PDNC005]QRY61540.1 urease accessory protein UreD [Gordonia sp. PDNC005]
MPEPALRAAVGVTAAPGRARVRLSAAVGATLVPRLLGRTENSARVALVAGGAMILGGDTISLDIHVGAGCLLELSEVGGTVVYNADGVESWWTTRIVLDAGARLVWRGLETVISDGADLHRRTDVTMAESARAVIREVTVFGRSGERGGRLLLESAVTCGDTPLLVESLDVRGDHPQPGVLGGHRVMESILLAGAGDSAPSDIDTSDVMDLAGPGALARHLGEHLHESPLDPTWDRWTRTLMEDNT